MVNSEVKLYILDTIFNKDYLSEEFMCDLLGIVRNKDYLNVIEIKEKGICTSGYILKESKIELYLNNLVSYYNYIVNNGFLTNNKLSMNILVLHALVHELEHAYEFIEYNHNSFIKEIVDSSIFNNKSERFYIKYHDIFPVELHAEGSSVLFIKDIIDTLEINKDYFNYLVYIISNILKLYKYKYKKLIPPMERYYSKIKGVDRYNNIDISSISVLDRFIYGLESDNNNFNISVNKLFNTSGVDYSELIRVKKI